MKLKNFFLCSRNGGNLERKSNGKSHNEGLFKDFKEQFNFITKIFHSLCTEKWKWHEKNVSKLKFHKITFRLVLSSSDFPTNSVSSIFSLLLILIIVAGCVFDRSKKKFNLSRLHTPPSNYF